MKIRINDLARELEVHSKAILDILIEVGVTEKKTHSSSVEEDEAERVRAFFLARSSFPRTVNPSAERKPRIDLSKISRPGDVARLLREREQQQYQKSAFSLEPPPVPPAVPHRYTPQPPKPQPPLVTPPVTRPAPPVVKPQPPLATPPAKPPTAPRSYSAGTPSLPFSENQPLALPRFQTADTQTGAATAAAPAKHSEPFPFMQDGKLKDIAERDHAELKKVKGIDAVKSRYLLIGSLLESLLLDALLQQSQKAHAAKAAVRHSKGTNIDRWPLVLLIAVSVELDIVRPEVKEFTDRVRDFRNVIHPAHEKRSRYGVRTEIANILEDILNLVISDLKNGVP